MGFASLTFNHQIFENLPINSWGFSVKGIRPEGRCPICTGTFKLDMRRGYLCPEHLTTPARFTIDFFYKGERIRRGTTLDGKTLRSFADAHALLQQAKNQIEAHKFDPKVWKSSDRIEFRFSHQVYRWYSEKEMLMQQGKLAPGYVTKLFTYIKHYFEPFFGSQDVREIFNCKDFVFSLPKMGNGALSLKYQHNIVNSLKGFFNWLKYERIISDLPLIPSIKVPEYVPTTISRDLQIEILSLIPQIHKPIFTFLFYQGCRPGEARALKWDSIYNDIVTYRRTWSGRTLKETTKTKNIRHNLLFPEVLAILPIRGFPDSFVFVHGGNNKPYSSDFLNSIFNKTLKFFNDKHGTSLRIGLYEATKHSFGTQLINQGVPEHLLQGWFGHTKPEMTKKYAKLKIVDAFRDLQKIIVIQSAASGNRQ